MDELNEFERVRFLKHEINSCEAWIKSKQDAIKQNESHIESIKCHIYELGNALKDAEKKLHDREHIAYLNAKLDNRMTESIHDK
jgi:peptidoglycan hydrolase CwlO-like protein